MKACQKCLQDNDDAANFCILCRSPFGSAAALTCARGHIVDPTWTECAYCKAEMSAAPVGADSMKSAGGSGRPKTVVEGPGDSQAAFPRPQDPPRTPASSTPAQASNRRKTVFIGAPPAEEGEAIAAPRSSARKIVGVLVTYSWKPEGQMFPVREGRNLIGRGADCEICLPEDQTLSHVNSHITYRKNFIVGDMVSMSGTDLNGVPIEEQFVPLANRSQIRTGSTHWTFLTIQLPESE